jgi:chemotaxis protein MotB
MIADLQTQAFDRETSLAAILAALTVQEDRAAELTSEVTSLQTRLSEEESNQLAEAAAAAALRERLAGVETALSEQEVARLADAAAALALRERLANSDAELTAMALALEEQRQAAENTLTLLAAAELAQVDLTARLVGVLVDMTVQSATAGSEVADLQARLSAAILARQSEGELAGQEIEDLEERLAALLVAQELAESQASTDLAGLQDQLAAAISVRILAEADRDEQLSEAEQRAILLAQANVELSQAEAQTAQQQRQVAALNEQVAALRAQLGGLQNLLDASAARDADADVQIQALGSQLNSALAQVASEQRARADLEAAERARLEEEAVELERYRSEFFGRLRNLLEGREGVRIEGDRFVFSSEVLFEPGAANLAQEGRAQIANVAQLLLEISDDIPEALDWIIRVDGHTDNIPLSGFGEYANNWELSQARALSVVLYMSESLGIPPFRLAATGFGEFRPISTEDTPEARAQNRRIELKLTER